LDRVTSGVIIYAKTSKAASRLSADFRDRLVQKTYVCVVNGSMNDKDKTGELKNTMVQVQVQNSNQGKGKGKNGVNKSKIVDEINNNAQKAHLSYEKICRINSEYTRDKEQHLLSIMPSTGRKHQIRLQLSHRGWPIVGDIKYGAPQRFAVERDIALHSLTTSIRHPTSRSREGEKDEIWLTFSAPLPDIWRKRFGPEVVLACENVAKKNCGKE